MERERLGDRVVVGRRVRADLLELADVVRPARRRPACSGQIFAMFSRRT